RIIALIYTTKDTYVSLAMSRGVDVAWLQEQTGVAYETLRRHYGKWMRSHGSDQIRKLVARPAQVDPRMDPRWAQRSGSRDVPGVYGVRGGGLEPGEPAEF